MRVKVFVLSFVVMLLASVAVLPATAQDAPTFEPTECQFDVPDDLVIDCGFVTVPENRANPENDNTLRLAVAVVRTQSDTPQPDPIIYLDGGPGGQTIGGMPELYVNQFAPFADADRDIIFFDQRGIGFSEPNLFCQDLVDLDLELLENPVSDVESNELFFNSAFSCRAQYIAAGIDLSAFNTTENAADVDAIREALGYEQLNLLGISYGSLLAQVVMRDFGDNIRSVVLDGVVDPAAIQFSVAGQINQLQNAFDTLFAACDNDPACSEAYPNLEELTFALADAWNENPIEVGIELQDGTTYNAVIDGADALRTIVLLFYITDAAPIIPLYIYEMALGDFRRLSLIRGAQVDQLSSFYDGMLYSVICQEDGPFITEALIDETLENASPVMAEYVEADDVSPYEVIRLCSDWTSGFMTGDLSINPVESDLPTLLLSGEYDPVTPVEFADTVQETLPNSFSYELPGGGHGVSIDGGCSTDITLQFIQNPTQEPDTSCIADIEFEFVIVDLPGIDELIEQFEAGQTPQGGQDQVATQDEPLNADALNLVPFSDGELGISGVQPEGWDRVDNVVFALVAGGNQYQLAYRVPEDGLTGYLQRIVLEDGFYGYEALPAPVAFYEVNGRTWKIYDIENAEQGVYSQFAITEVDGQAYIIGMVAGSAEERDALYDPLFLPAIDAFEISE